MKRLLPLVLAGCALAAQAQTFPVKPVRFFVPSPPGSAPDIIMRSLGESLSQSWGQPIITENRPGAAGIISNIQFIKLPPDGYAYTFASSAVLTIHPNYYKNLPYDTEKELQPVIDVSNTHWILVTGKDSPIKSVRELIAQAKANPGRISYGSQGAGSADYMAAELLRLKAGIDLLHVPFKDSVQMHTAVMRGDVGIAFTAYSGLTPAMRDRLSILAVAARERKPLIPGIPTIEEMGGPAGFEATVYGLMATRRGTPRDIVMKVHSDVVRSHQTPEMIKRLQNQNMQPTQGRTPEELERFVREELGRYKEVIEKTGQRGEL
jgi:tripartite-type tricarboxylate transporter receptor subunit TctC